MATQEQIAREHITAAEVRGFRVIDQHPRRSDLKPGARVRHSAHRWDDAYMSGTADVVAVMRRGSDERPDSWEQQYGRPNIEVIVNHDGEITEWTDYHTAVVEMVGA